MKNLLIILLLAGGVVIFSSSNKTFPLRASLSDFSEEMSMSSLGETHQKIQTKVAQIKQKKLQLQNTVETLSAKTKRTVDTFQQLQTSLDDFRDSLKTLFSELQTAQDQVLGEVPATEIKS